MRRRCGRLVSTGLVLVGLSACADNNASVFIEGLIRPEPDDSGCTWDAEGDSLLFPVFDLGFKELAERAGVNVTPRYGSYDAVFRVSNVARNNVNDLRANSNGVFLRRAEISLRTETELLPTGANPYSVSISNFIPAGDGTTPSTNAVEVKVIPDEIRAVLPVGRVIASIQLFGETQGGVDVETGPFQMFIETCDNNCLAYCLDATSQETFEPSCDPGQDGGTGFLCPLGVLP